MKSIFKIALVILVVYYFAKKESNNTFDSTIKDLEKVINSTSDSREEREINNNYTHVDFYIRSIGYVDQDYLTNAVRIMKEFYGFNCVIRPGLPLTDPMKINGTDEILNARSITDELKEYPKTIFIVDKKLWWANKELRGFTDGSRVIVRANKSILRETLIHEVGHTLGLSHCEDKTCIMAIHNDEFDSGKFCSKCRNQIKHYFK